MNKLNMEKRRAKKEALEKLIFEKNKIPWPTSILSWEENQLYIDETK